jgi:DNA-binding NarL/FixJ family response regulator
MSATMHRFRTLIVDDNLAWRSTLRLCLLTLSDMEIVGEAANGQNAIELCRELNPDLVLLDINMPGMNGFETARALLAQHPELWIIGVSAETNPEHNRLAKEAGFNSVIPKDMLLDYLPTNFYPPDDTCSLNNAE